MGSEEEQMCLLKDKPLCLWMISLSTINIFHKRQLKDL